MRVHGVARLVRIPRGQRVHDFLVMADRVRLDLAHLGGLGPPLFQHPVQRREQDGHKNILRGAQDEVVEREVRRHERGDDRACRAPRASIPAGR